MLAPCVWAHTPVGTGLVVRGGDLSCEAETHRGGSSSGKLVEDAANWPKIGRLASVGLDQGLFSSLSRIFALTLSILSFTLSMVLEYLVVLREVISASKGTLIRALVTFLY
jgi:hypothetical protein